MRNFGKTAVMIIRWALSLFLMDRVYTEAGWATALCVALFFLYIEIEVLRKNKVLERLKEHTTLISQLQRIIEKQANNQLNITDALQTLVNKWKEASK